MTEWSPSDTAYMTTLNGLLDRYFDKEEMRTMCFELGLDYDDLRGEGKAGNVRELVRLMARDGRLSELVRKAQTARMRVTWPSVPADFGQGATAGPEYTSRPGAAPGTGLPPGSVIQAQTVIIGGEHQFTAPLSTGNNVQAQGDVNMSDQFNMSGDFRGAILNIKSTLTNVTQTINTLPNADQSAKDELKKLIAQLNDALQKAPQDKAEDAEAVAAQAEALVDAANKDKPNKKTVQITGEGLKKAAENIAGVMPIVVTIAGQIIAAVTKIIG